MRPEMDATLPATHRLADLILGEPLEDFVRTRRSEGRSWRLIERDLYDASDRQVDVSYETLRSWFPEDRAAAAIAQGACPTCTTTRRQVWHNSDPCPEAKAS